MFWRNLLLPSSRKETGPTVIKPPEILGKKDKNLGKEYECNRHQNRSGL
jgi:hypothetical protein